MRGFMSWVAMSFPFVPRDAQAHGGAGALTTVPHVDLARYMGLWYEIACLPQPFQNGGTAAIAHYAMRKDGRIAVMNACRARDGRGRAKVAHGVARVADPDTNAKLKVSFFWPFAGDYWIIDLGRDYEFAVIGHPSRRFLWILSRTPKMDESVFAGITHRLATEKGYDLSPLVRIPWESFP